MALRGEPGNRDYQRDLFHAVARRSILYCLFALPSRTFESIRRGLRVLRDHPWIAIFLVAAFMFLLAFVAWLTVATVLSQLPPGVASSLQDAVREVLSARTGPFLWFGAIVSLWSVGSFIETIRDILRRCDGVKFCAPFWEYRLGSAVYFVYTHGQDTSNGSDRFDFKLVEPRPAADIFLLKAFYWWG